MKKQMSMSFLLFGILALFTLGDILGVFQSLPYISRSFSLGSIVSFLIRIVKTFAPLAIVVLLYFNSKQDIKPIAYPLLLVLGCTWLLSEALWLRTLPALFSQPIYAWIPTLLTHIAHILIGCLFIMSALCVKNQQKKGLMILLTSIGFYISIVPLLLPLFTGGGFSLSATAPFLLLTGICLLPVTIFDYEHCIKVSGTSLKVVAILAAVVFGIYWIAGSYISGGSSGTSGRTCAKAGCNRKAEKKAQNK